MPPGSLPAAICPAPGSGLAGSGLHQWPWGRVGLTFCSLSSCTSQNPAFGPWGQQEKLAQPSRTCRHSKARNAPGWPAPSAAGTCTPGKLAPGATFLSALSSPARNRRGFVHRGCSTKAGPGSPPLVHHPEEPKASSCCPGHGFSAPARRAGAQALRAGGAEGRQVFSVFSYTAP